jgi:DNA-binding protein H-NS
LTANPAKETAMNNVPTASAKNGTPHKPDDQGPSSSALPNPPVLKSLSDEALDAHIADAQREKEERTERKREATLAILREHAELAKVLGLPPARIAAALSLRSAPKGAPKVRAEGGTDGRRNVSAKYRNPKDHAQRWSGRGGRPQWVADHLAAGGTMEEFTIAEGGSQPEGAGP